MQDNIDIWQDQEVHMEFQVRLEPKPSSQELDFLWGRILALWGGNVSVAVRVS